MISAKIASAVALACSAFFAASSPAKASPGVDFVCFDQGLMLTIGLDLEWNDAYLNTPSGDIELKSAGTGNSGGLFEFANGEYRFVGARPDGQLTGPDGIDARCWQSARSIKNIALYGAGANGEWSANLGDGTEVSILANTGEFLDGFYWFHIRFDDDQRGYIWGALLCYDSDNPELDAALRRCE